MGRAVIILTGTVNPGTTIYTQLIDPVERKKQYVETIHYWLKSTDLPIVFVENSGTDISNEIRNDKSDRIEFLVFEGNNYPRELGKGFGELNCLKYAFSHSLLLKECDFVFKVTGRYKVLNFSRIHKCYIENNSIEVLIDLKDSLRFADSRIFGFTPSFFHSFFVKRHEEMNDSTGCFFEIILAKAVLSSIIEGRYFKQLPVYPKLVGVSATSNESYQTHFVHYALKNIKFFLKSRFLGGY